MEIYSTRHSECSRASDVFNAITLDPSLAAQRPWKRAALMQAMEKQGRYLLNLRPARLD